MKNHWVQRHKMKHTSFHFLMYDDNYGNTIFDNDVTLGPPGGGVLYLESNDDDFVDYVKNNGARLMMSTDSYSGTLSVTYRTKLVEEWGLIDIRVLGHGVGNKQVGNGSWTIPIQHATIAIASPVFFTIQSDFFTI